MTRITRRLALSAAGALALAGAPAVWAQGQPIKIGLLLIDSGPFATHAALMESGAKTAVDLLNGEGGALGRKFELVIQNHSGTPAAAVAAATKLAQQSGVSLIIGQTLSSHSLALVPKLDSLNVLQIDHYAQSNDLMTKSCAPNYFRVNTPEGFGICRHYSPQHGYDNNYTVRDSTIFMAPHGYHTTCSAPGYTNYFLWFLAGNIRQQAVALDPDLAWVQKAVPLING